MNILEILGIVFLAVIAILLGILLRFYRRVRPHIDSGADHLCIHSALPPIRLRLDKSSKDNWVSGDQFLRYEATLKKKGFTHAGYHVMCIGKSRTQISFWNQSKKGLMFTIMEEHRLVTNTLRTTPADNVIFNINLSVQFTDGCTLTATTNEDAELMPRPGKHKLLKSVGADLNQLFRILKKALPKNKKIKPSTDMKAVFLAVHEQCSEWVWQEEQLRSPQIYSLAETLGIELTDELIHRLLEQSSNELSELYTTRILRIFAGRSNMSAKEWEQYRERLVVVHEKMPPAEVAHCVYELVSQLKDELEQELDTFAELPTINQPIKVFHKFLKKAQAGKTVTRLVTIDKPINAEIYLTG